MTTGPDWGKILDGRRRAGPEPDFPWARLSEEARSEILDGMLLMEGPEIVLEVNRTPEARRRDGGQVTMSKEAMDYLAYQMLAWVGSRILREHDHGQMMAQNIKVTVNVQLDDKDAV